MQLHLGIPVTRSNHDYDYGDRSSGEKHGVVLTKPHVVDLIVDLVGYTAEKDLPRLRLLEPSCGHGAFLVPCVARLLTAAKRLKVRPEELSNCICAIDIDQEHVEKTRETIAEVLKAHRVPDSTIALLCKAWVHQSDFLLESFSAPFDFVIGNPPYVRIEQIAVALQSEYRARYRTLYDRADLYVAFIERSLSLLSNSGLMSFICADRWVLNKYGAPLRELITSKYSVRCFIDMHRASPFESDVVAYPSVFVFGSACSGAVPVVTMQEASAEECRNALVALRKQPLESSTGLGVSWHASWFQGDEPWTMTAPECLTTLRELEARYEPLEAHAKVGIGVATGNDKVYLVKRDTEIEPSRLVPVVMRKDIVGGKVRDAGRFVINVFNDDGGLVDLDKFPGLRRHLDQHAGAIKARHVAKKNPKGWFRTIDRVYPALVSRPKLLVPDIAGANEVAFDSGSFHPHHNLYMVTSEEWDLEVLGGLLSSRVALFFVWSYALKMRGGYLRFQAQYLRRIRVPAPDTLPASLQSKIRDAFRNRDFAKLDKLALSAYAIKELPEFDFVDTRA